jgi:hypothetical protein
LRFNSVNEKNGGIKNELPLLSAFLDLLSHCDSALRRYGVRSARLRRAELIINEEEKRDKHNENNTFRFAPVF